MQLKDLDIYSIGNTIGMIGAVYTGEGKTFVTLFPGERLEHDVEELPMTTEEWQQFLLQTDTLDVEALSKTTNGKIVKAIVRKGQRLIDNVVSWKVFKRDGYRCRYCGNDNIPLTVDHLVLWEEFGPSIEANLVASCKKCNRTRGNMSYAEWLRCPHYLRVSKKLTDAVRAANEALLATLDAIPRVAVVRSR